MSPRRVGRHRLSVRDQRIRLRGFAALNDVRRGKFDSLSDAARAAGTTVPTIKKNLPAAVTQERPGGRIHVKAFDPYWVRVQILTDEGAVEVIARGSRQRELAGHHRAVWIKVLRGELSPSALEEFRDRKVGGHALINDPDRLFELLRGGELSQLDAVYVSPETRG